MKIIDSTQYKPSTFNLFYKIPSEVDTSILNHSLSLAILSFITLNHILYPFNTFHPIPSCFFKNYFGRDYAKALNELRYLKYIERKVICSHTGNYFSFRDKIAASYKLSGNLLKSIRSKNFKFIPVTIKYKPPASKNGRFCIKNKTKSPKSLKILDSYTGVSVDSSWLNYFHTDECFPSNHPKYPNEPLAQHGVFIHSRYIVESMLNKKICINTKSRCKRVFHPLILITRGVRKYFRKNGQNLVNIDAKSFHPFLIASCIGDKEKREEYLELVRNGFYEIFADENYSRDMIKVSLQKYLSGRPTNDSKVLEIGRWYEENFPDVPLKMMELKSKRKKFQMYLQQLEASIFVDEVFMKADFWCLPMHDGLCVLQKDVDAACGLIDRACESRLGYRIILESH
jgi:hypothetical protein